MICSRSPNDSANNEKFFFLKSDFSPSKWEQMGGKMLVMCYHLSLLWSKSLTYRINTHRHEHTCKHTHAHADPIYQGPDYRPTRLLSTACCRTQCFWAISSPLSQEKILPRKNIIAPNIQRQIKLLSGQSGKSPDTIKSFICTTIEQETRDTIHWHLFNTLMFTSQEMRHLIGR